jgi:hypothetical protein
MTPKGLILVPDFTADIGNNSLTIRNIGGKFMVDAVRRNLPYWDKFDFPNNMIIGSVLPAELATLAQEGIVQQSNPRFQFSGGAAELWVRSQLAAWQARESIEPGVWTLGQFGNQLWLPESERSFGRTIELELHCALPVPGSETRLDQILEFKVKRSAELAAFRLAMDRLYLSVIDSGDLPRARNTAIDSIEAALKDLDRTTSESFPQRLLSSLKVELSANVLTTAAAAGYAAAQVGFPIALGAGAGAVASMLKFELTPKGTQPVKQGRGDFAYLYDVRDNL